MSEKPSTSPLTEKKDELPKKTSRIKAIVTGAFIGVAATAIAGNNYELSTGLVSYAVLRKTAQEFAKRQPDWVKLAVDGALIVPVFLLLSQSMDQAWNAAITMEIQAYTKMGMYELIDNAEKLRDIPEVYLYALLFLSLSVQLWPTLTRMGYSKAKEYFKTHND